MTAYLLTNHLLNFMAPAALVALLLVPLSRLLSRFFTSKKPLVPTFWRQVAIVFMANTAVLTAGLLVFGHDGKMLTYAGLVVVAALCQWVLLRGWKA